LLCLWPVHESVSPIAHSFGELWEHCMGKLSRMIVRLMGLSLMMSMELSAPFSGRASWLYAQETQQAAAPGAVAKPVGTIKAIAGNTITLTTDAVSDVTVLVQDTTRLVRVAPGQKDLKDAAPIQLQNLQPGDRILVRGKLSDDAKSVLAASIIAMKKTDIAEKQAQERAEWQKHGVGGLVSAVDATSEIITIGTMTATGNKIVAIHVSKATIVRRYAPESVKFDDAKPSTLDQIKPGDQLRARGARSAEASEFTADEIVSGAFRNIAGTISAVDARGGILTVADLATKKPVQIKVTLESQLRKLPPPMAQRMAMRLKGVPPDVPAAAGAPKPGEAPAGPPAGAAAGPRNSAAGGPGGAGRNGGGGDLQQMIGRMPAATLADFQKGEAVMIVATQGQQDDQATAITLLGGVEPILEASPQGAPTTVLSPWSLNTGGVDVATP
jgi:hypothetical protein